MPQFEGWVPILVRWQDGSPQVEWILLGDERFSDPFFEDTIQRALRHPFHQAFRRRTGMDELRDWNRESPGLAPKGFVFHMSRCGSTLLGQMLRAVEGSLVLSEAAPLDSVLRSHMRDPSLTRDQRADWLSWMLSALGQKRQPAEERVFVKFDCWSISELPVVRQAFPDVPWIFIYRDPLEVLVSQMQRRALWSVPGALSPAVLGLQPEDLADAPQDEYCARMLGRICEIALAHLRRDGIGLPVNYSELPDFYQSGMFRHFNVDVRPGDIERMREAAVFYSKTPGLIFEPDGQRKEAAATDRMRELADRWIAPHYRQLELAGLNREARASASIGAL